MRRACYCEKNTSDESTSVSSGETEECDGGYTHACHNTIDAMAHAPGTADCVLSDVSGALIDRATVRVSEAMRATFVDEGKGESLGSAITTSIGQSLSVRVTLRNANGELILNERVPRAVIDELIAEVAAAQQSAEVGEQAGTPA